jgi:branched-chain amino acid transport system permease protein
MGVTIVSLYFAVLALCWGLLSGFTGLFSLAPATFGMIGAYTTGLLGLHYGTSPFVGILAAVIVTAFLGFVVGRLTLGLVGPYFALTTLALAEIVRQVILNSYSITRGDLGITVPSLFPDRVFAYYSFIVFVGLMLCGLYALLEQPCGYFLQAIRDDELGARAKGVRTVYWKIFAFSLTSGLSGLAGAIYAHFAVVISPDLGLPLITGLIIAMVVIGGNGTLIGPLVGALFVNTASEYLRGIGSIHLIVFSALVILFARFLPEGLCGLSVRLVEKVSALRRREYPDAVAPGARNHET